MACTDFITKVGLRRSNFSSDNEFGLAVQAQAHAAGLGCIDTNLSQCEKFCTSTTKYSEQCLNCISDSKTCSKGVKEEACCGSAREGLECNRCMNTSGGDILFCTSDSGLNTGEIVAISMGSFVFIAIIVFIVVMRLRKRVYAKQKEYNQLDPMLRKAQQLLGED